MVGTRRRKVEGVRQVIRRGDACSGEGAGRSGGDRAGRILDGALRKGRRGEGVESLEHVGAGALPGELPRTSAREATARTSRDDTALEGLGREHHPGRVRRQAPRNIQTRGDRDHADDPGDGKDTGPPQVRPRPDDCVPAGRALQPPARRALPRPGAARERRRVDCRPRRLQRRSGKGEGVAPGATRQGADRGDRPDPDPGDPELCGAGDVSAMEENAQCRASLRDEARSHERGVA